MSRPDPCPAAPLSVSASLGSAATLNRRLFLYFAAAMLVLALAMGAATILPLHSRLIRSEEGGLLHAAQTRALAVGEWFRRAGELAGQITSRTQIRNLMEDVAEGRASREDFASFAGERLMDAMRLSPDMVGITRLGPDGAVLALCGEPIPRAVGNVPASGAGFPDTAGPVVLGGRSCMVVGAAIPGSHGGEAGRDLVAMDTSGLRAKLALPPSGGGRTRLVLGRRSGEGEWTLVDGGDGLTSPPPALSRTELQGLALAAGQGAGVLSTPEEAVAYAPVEGTGWALILTEDARRLYAPVRQETWGMLAAAGGILALSLAGFGFMLRPLAGRILLHASELASLVEERQALSRELITLMEGLRLDLSRELHDHTGQQLTTLRLQLNAAMNQLPSGDSCRLQLESASRKLDRVQGELKEITRGLRPDTLDMLGLPAALEALVEEQRASSGLALHFFHKDAPPDLDRDKALALYRIAQESLSNVVRHAGARTVHVSLVGHGDRLTLTVEDDGRGFDPAARARRPGSPPLSLGLTLMRERMLQHGGVLTVESAPGQGAHVAAELAL